MGKCAFNDRWLHVPAYRHWLSRDTANNNKAYCRLCLKSVDISTMGESAVKSHMKAKKHVQEQRHRDQIAQGKSLAIPSIFRPTSAAVSASGSGTVATGAAPASSCASGSQQPGPCSGPDDTGTHAVPVTLNTFVSKNETLKAEIMWSLKVMSSHYSYKSSEATADLFKSMFPDSHIAKSFTCGERKCSYMCCFGLAPHFRRLMLKDVTQQDGFVLLFDESLNRPTKNKQMDVHVRSWFGDQVATRYCGSQFMGHATADDMMEHFHQATTQLNMRQLWQLSMDGPNVNWKFHEMLQQEMKVDHDMTLLNIGSCGLHVIHGAFKDGCVACEWNLKHIFSSMYILFNETPARREDYVKATGSNVFPVKFCYHRWLENVPIAERTLLIWQHIKKYVGCVEKKTCPNPRTASFDTIKAACSDVLTTAKIHFFLSVSKQIVPFLTIYQTDRPMVPFLCDDLHRMVKGLLQRFVKPDILNDANTVQKLLKLDVEDTATHVSYKKIDVGFAAEDDLRQLGSKVSSRQVMDFRMNCKSFVQTTVKKILLKAPIKYALVRNLSCLDPRCMATERDASVTKMRNVLKLLVENNRVQGGMAMCDDLMREFTDFVDVVVPMNLALFKNFDPHDSDARVDQLLSNFLANQPAYRRVWEKVIKKLLLLSHGQASVERGFSINRQIEVENLHEESLVAQRIICDHLQAVGGILKVNISNELLISASSARQKYMAHLEMKRNEKLREEGTNKRKSVLDEIDEMKTKKKRIKTDIDSLNASADQFAEKAETTGNLTLITKSNSMRRTMKEKTVELQDLERSLDEKVQSLKTC